MLKAFQHYFQSKAPAEGAGYREVVLATKGMVGDAAARRLARERGLDILSVTWEDTGRFKGSAVGPNISDMTIQVEARSARGAERHCMPVIRHPNFSDLSADVPLDAFHVLVGNQRGEALQPVSLRELLGDLRSFLHDPSDWAGEERSLLAERDSHALVSAQACFLPIPKKGDAGFNPVLFNYQSRQGAPAVLTILATREGTSITVIDNVRDGFSEGGTWGQRLFFNDDGQRASLQASRKSDFLQTAGGSLVGDPAAQEALNLVLLVQVPLVQPAAAFGFDDDDGVFCATACAPGGAAVVRRGASTVEDAVISHGAHEGPFTEIGGLSIERDPRFPIRVTVQFYKATDNGVVSVGDMDDIAAQIKRVYDEAEHVDSLVTQGRTARPTEHDGPQQEPPGWWAGFWAQHQANTGQSSEDAWRALGVLLGRPARSPQEAEGALRR